MYRYLEIFSIRFLMAEGVHKAERGSIVYARRLEMNLVIYFRQKRELDANNFTE